MLRVRLGLESNRRFEAGDPLRIPRMYAVFM